MSGGYLVRFRVDAPFWGCGYLALSYVKYLSVEAPLNTVWRSYITFIADHTDDYNSRQLRKVLCVGQLSASRATCDPSVDLVENAEIVCIAADPYYALCREQLCLAFPIPSSPCTTRMALKASALFRKR